jgi:hypothetical protein
MLPWDASPDLKGACRLLSQGPTWSITINRLNQRTNTMEQKEMQSLKHKLPIKGVSLLAAATALTAAVGQQGRVVCATNSSVIDLTVLPIEFLRRL